MIKLSDIPPEPEISIEELEKQIQDIEDEAEAAGREEEYEDFEAALEADLQNAVDLLGRVNDMFMFLDIQTLKGSMTAFQSDEILRLDNDITEFLNTTIKEDR